MNNKFTTGYAIRILYILMKEELTITQNKVITMQYALSNADGVIIREAGNSPITYLHGAGVLFSRLEQALEHHKTDDIITARLLPEDAFGKRNPDLVQEVPLSSLPPGENIEAGGHITGNDEQGNEVTFSVTEIKYDIVYLDGNHPLAGQTLHFEVEIQGIRDATEEEIRSGKAIA